VGRDSSVNIVTRYGLEFPGIESRWGVRFSTPIQTGPGDHPASCTMGTGSLRRGGGLEQPGGGVEHPLHLTSMLKKEQSYTLLSYGPPWPVLQ